MGKKKEFKDALAAIARAESSSASALPFDDIPPEIIGSGRNLDLRPWSMLFSDDTARRVASKARSREARSAELKMHSYHSSAMPEDDEDESMLDADRKRRLERREAFIEQIKLAEDCAMKNALREAQDEIGLQEISVGGAYKLTDAGVLELASACGALTALDLGGASKITDASLRSVAKHCTKLKRLDVGGCSKLCGPGLAAIGAMCKDLETVRLAGCGQATTGWALAALVKGCGLSLTSLDVSHCMLLNDADCGTIAKFSPSLTSLSLSYARQVSDVGVVAIANSCSSLETLKLARSELPHRLTDVALLSVAESCGRTLKELDLRGCSSVTDVGVSWIAHQSGPNLTSISLRGCERVGNAACRALADHCSKLQSIDLRGARRVTDVGIRVLFASLGDVVEYLDCSLLHLLTDGPSDRGFGFEGLLALARDASKLKALHLDGCFQVSTRALTALSKARIELRELGLAGCPRISVAGVTALVAANGRTLEKLSLAGCGNCVSDSMICSIARSTTRLRQLILRNCENWGVVGARTLAQRCRKLERLDCTGCKGVGDNAIACIADARFEEPGLRHLLLAFCPNIGDIGLAWLADGPGGADLVTLSLLKTCCTTSALKSYRDRFVHSEFCRDAEFFGFKPKPRWEHRICIHFFGKKRDAVIKLQSSYRALCDRRRARKKQEQLALNAAATQVQKMWRRELARARVAGIRARLHLERISATAIQAGARVSFAMRVKATLEAEAFLRLSNDAARKIETAWRGLVDRRFARRLRKELADRARQRERAAIFIQRIYRGFLGRIASAARWKEVLDERIRRNDAASNIQRRARALLAQLLVQAVREANAKYRDRAQRAAVLIQSRVRRNRMRNVISIRRALFDAKVKTAILIQSIWRARRDRLVVYIAAADRRRKQERIAAETLQRAERVRFSRRYVAQRRSDLREELRRKTSAAIVIQCAVRLVQALRHFALIKQERVDTQRKLANIKVWAATTVAAGWRGYQGRQRALRALEEKRARWKEMFDEDSRRPFYYNQLTGEIRWRRPQELLELMKRPVCSNCAYFEAAMECDECQEFFCNECWSQVHYGGKRASHRFRSLYDAYGRRVDYGDGDLSAFESRWPSEILQDDVNGILLRIAPHREPVETIGAWQRYEDCGDAHTSKDRKVDGDVTDEGNGAQAVSFYYNPITGEGTYEPPLAIERQSQQQQLQQQQQSTMSPYELAKYKSMTPESSLVTSSWSS